MLTLCASGREVKLDDDIWTELSSMHLGGFDKEVDVALHWLQTGVRLVRRLNGSS